MRAGWRGGAFVLGLIGVACGGAGPGAAGGHGGSDLEPAVFLEEVGAADIVVLRRPQASIEALESARRAARGRERRAAGRDVATARMFAAEGLEGRPARRAQRELERALSAARQGPRDGDLDRELDFLQLWASWRAGSVNAARLAERFTTRNAQVGGPLLLHAWILRGEVALAAGEHEPAIEAYRFALGHLDSPLYGFALLRTAHAQAAAGRTEDAQQALSEVERLGCAPSASDPVRRLAAAAAGERGTAMRDEAGRAIPSSCPERTAGGDDGEAEGGWTPEE